MRNPPAVKACRVRRIYQPAAVSVPRPPDYKGLSSACRSSRAVSRHPLPEHPLHRLLTREALFEAMARRETYAIPHGERLADGTEQMVWDNGDWCYRDRYAGQNPTPEKSVIRASERSPAPSAMNSVRPARRSRSATTSAAFREALDTGARARRSSPRARKSS